LWGGLLRHVIKHDLQDAPDESVVQALEGLRLCPRILKSIDIVPDKIDNSTIRFADDTALRFARLDRLIPCFTPGTIIASPRGGVAVEALKTGDRVITRDNGIQTLSWVGRKRLDHIQLKALPALRPIKIMAGALGQNTPDRDMLVSPGHRMLIVSELARARFGQAEILITAKDLVGVPGVEVSDSPYVTYVHFMCDHHELVLCDGAWSESFQPADFSIKGLDADQRAELFELFPDLETKQGIKAYAAARATISKKQAKLFFKAK
jgi:hypothetical protein